MLTTLFSDLGDVMFIFDRKIFSGEIQRRTGRIPERLNWDKSAVLDRAFKGRISGKRYLEIRARELGISPHELTEIWNMAVRPNKPYFDFLQEWKAEGKKLYLLSNINVVAWRYYRQRFPIFQIFDGLFLSYRLRLAKPDPHIFQKCLEKAGAQPEESLLVDDLKENIEAASRLGFKTWQYLPEEHDLLLNFLALYEKTH